MDRCVQQGLLEKFKETINIIEKELPFEIQLPMFPTNLVIVGDLIHEVVTREAALKISETCYIPVRSFGLEEFLHGPRITLDKLSSLLIFSSMSKPRRDTLITYAKIVGSEVISIDEEKFESVPQEFRWLAQLLWGQQLALELSKELGTNPDAVRADQDIYKEAKNHITL
jgi:fructoselysine-6-P-deglycase FrlB-like protein